MGINTVDGKTENVMACMATIPYRPHPVMFPLINVFTLHYKMCWRGQQCLFSCHQSNQLPMKFDVAAIYCALASC